MRDTRFIKNRAFRHKTMALVKAFCLALSVQLHQRQVQALCFCQEGGQDCCADALTTPMRQYRQTPKVAVRQQTSGSNTPVLDFGQRMAGR